MKMIATLLLAGALLPASLLAAAFEGKVSMKISSAKDKPAQMTFSVKEGLSRIDVAAKGGEGAGIIMNAAKQEILILMDSEKMYMVQPLPKPGETSHATGATADVTVEKTSVTEKILGYDTVKYVAKEKSGTTEMWVTDQLGSFMGMGPGGENPMSGKSKNDQAWASALAGKDLFPLRVVTSAGSKETFRMEATSVEKTTLPASLFVPPADYQKFDMAAMMGGMMPGGK